MPSRDYPSVTTSVHRREFVIEPADDLAGMVRHILANEVALPVSVDRSFWWREDDLIPPTAKIGLVINDGIAALGLEWSDADEVRYREDWDAARDAREAVKAAAAAAAEAEDEVAAPVVPPPGLWDGHEFPGEDDMDLPCSLCGGAWTDHQ